MFFGRSKELQELKSELSNWDKKTAILVYGKRRVGKSTLIQEAARDFQGIVIHHLCVASSFEGNLNLICKTVSEALSLPPLQFNTLFDLMDFLGSRNQRTLFVIDEYPYLKQNGKKNEVDSVIQAVIDRLPGNIKLILCGSYITTMKELLTEENPLFGRFSLIQHIRDFDYYEAAAFYPHLNERDKIAFYAVFGGSPYVLENLNTHEDLAYNIKRFLLPETGLIRSHIENVMLKEIRKSFDARILETLANGRKKYSDIRNDVGGHDTGLLDKQLKILLDMETIHKTEPVNRRNDKKKQFYEISDNLMRFYFSYIFGKAGIIARIGAEQFYHTKIASSLTQFISLRLKGIVLQYFHRMALLNNIPDLEDYGTYWYDDPETNTHGEFDCVIKRRGEQFDFYECKYYNQPMSREECEAEKQQLERIKGIKVSKIGFVCTGGFAMEDPTDFILLSGKNLYE